LPSIGWRQWGRTLLVRTTTSKDLIFRSPGSACPQEKHQPCLRQVVDSRVLLQPSLIFCAPVALPFTPSRSFIPYSNRQSPRAFRTHNPPDLRQIFKLQGLLRSYMRIYRIYTGFVAPTPNFTLADPRGLLAKLYSALGISTFGVEGRRFGESVVDSKI
jgi:hypothetical protein